MTRNAQDIIDDMRNIVKPRITKMLLESNFEGCGKKDKAEFETEFEIILTLAEKALEQEPILDKIRAEIEPKCDRINSLASVLPYTAHREIQELLCEIMDLCKAEIEPQERSDKE